MHEYLHFGDRPALEAGAPVFHEKADAAQLATERPQVEPDCRRARISEQAIEELEGMAGVEPRQFHPSAAGQPGDTEAGRKNLPRLS